MFHCNKAVRVCYFFSPSFVTPRRQGVVGRWGRRLRAFESGFYPGPALLCSPPSQSNLRGIFPDHIWPLPQSKENYREETKWHLFTRRGNDGNVWWHVQVSISQVGLVLPFYLIKEPSFWQSNAVLIGSKNCTI